MMTIEDYDRGLELAAAGIRQRSDGAVFVEGIPAPQGSKKAYVRGGRAVLVESSAKVKPWRDRVSAVMRFWTPIPAGVPVRVEVEFVMPRPKATPKRRTPPAVKRPDADKLVRSTLDALTGTRFSDDSQVVELLARKRIAEIGEAPGAWVWVKSVDAEGGKSVEYQQN